MFSSFDQSCKLSKVAHEKSATKSPPSRKVVLRSLSKNCQSRSSTKKSLLKITIDQVPTQALLRFNRRIKVPKVPNSSKNTSKKFVIASPSLNTRKNSSKLFATGSNRSLALSTSPKNSYIIPDKIEFPMRPTRALMVVKSILTDYEQGEILKYSEIYFVGKIENKLKTRADQENYGFDDKHADYLLVKNDHIAYRYEILDLLGKGSFGQVCECYDHKNKEKVALKIIKNKSKFHQQATIEAKILHTLREHDLEDSKNIVRMKNYFSFRNHICITFELISINLYEFLRLNSFKGLSIPLIKCFTLQILNSLNFLKTLQIIHCDLKPENVLLTNPQKASIKLIDFGSSCFITEKLHTYIQSRYYRAPEIMLGIPYTPAIDMWSLGCILTELYTGQPLWPGDTEKDQFLHIVSYFGLPPEDLLINACRKNVFFENGKLKYSQLSNGKVLTPGMFSFRECLKSVDEDFVDFLMKCFEWDPEKRISPSEALEHPWIQVQKLWKNSISDKRFKKK